MPRIPTSATDVRAVSPLSLAVRPQSGQTASIDTNAGTSAEARAGQEMLQFSNQFNALSREYDNTQRDSTVANGAASFNFEPTLLKMKTEAPPGGKDFAQHVADTYQDAVQDHVELSNIQDETARQKLTQTLMARMPDIAKSAAIDEFTMRGQQQQFETNQALSTSLNKVRTNPNINFDEVAQEADRVIQASTDLPASSKPEMTAQWRSKLGAAKFEELANKATSPDQIAAYRAQLEDTSQPWQRTLTPEVMEKTLSHLKSAETTLQTQVSAIATTRVAGLRERTTGSNPVVVSDSEMAEIGAQVRMSKSPAVAEEYAKLAAQQSIMRQDSSLPRDALRAKIQASNIAAQQGKVPVPTTLQGPLDAASMATGGKISTSYLVGMLGRENRGMLAGNAAAPGNGGGAGQFIPSTWLQVLPQLGVDTTGMSEQQKLDLRSNTALNLKASAILAAQNKGKMEDALGRPISDGELYLGHFLGAGGGPKAPGATEFIRAFQSDPSKSAASVVPSQAAEPGNRSVFYNRDGSARTVGQVYTEITSSFGASSGRLSYEQNEMRQKLLTHMDTQLSKDPMTFATTTYGSRFQPVPLSQPEAAGNNARAIADFYSIPRQDMKPLTEDQSAHIAKLIKDGTVDDQMAVMTVMQRMGNDMAGAAYKQIGENSPVFAYAGRLQLSGAVPAVVSDTLQGAQRIARDKSINEAPPMKREDMRTEFDTAYGPALSSLPPADRSAVFETARALYAQRYAADNLQQPFNPKAFGSAVGAVLGRNTAADAVGSVNGAKTLAPAGMTANQFDDALHKMTDADWTALSVNGAPPRFANGAVATTTQIMAEGRFIAVGGDNYQIAMADGKRLYSGIARSGLPLPYTMSAAKEQLLPILRRTVADRPQKLAGDDLPGGP